MNLLKNFAIYSAGNLVLKIIGAIISFISISFLTPTQFGALSLINSFIFILPIFLNLGLRQVFALEFFHSNLQERKEILAEIIAIYLSFSIPILLLLSVNISFLKMIFKQTETIIIFIALLISFLYFFIELFFQTLRYNNNAIQLTKSQICMAILNAVFAITLIKFLNLKMYGILISNLISILCIILYALILYKNKVGYISFNVLNNKTKLLYYLKYGLPYIPSIFFNYLMSYADRFVLAHYKSLHEVGIFSFADSFGLIYQSLIIAPLTSAYVPYILEQFAKNKENILQIDLQNQKNMYKFLFSMLALATIGFYLFKNFLFLILPVNYHESIKYILLILIEQIIFSASYFATCYLTFLKKIHLTISFTIIASLLNLALNYILVPTYSIYGCIFSTIISYFIYLFMIIFVTNKVKASKRSAITI